MAKRTNITIDVTETERQLIKDGAEASGFRGYSPWIRSMVLKEAKKALEGKV